MAAKKCPNCGSECPVASSSCKTCLHVFKSRKGSTSATSSSSCVGGTPEETSIGDNDATYQTLQEEKSAEIGSRRYTGRVTRTKPIFYDSLHVEEQMKQRKLLQRKQLKQSKFPEARTASADDPIGTMEAPAESKQVEPDNSRKKRGRPSSSRIGISSKMSTTQLAGNRLDSHEKAGLTPLEDDDAMLLVTPEKTLQFNVVLNEINRKLVTANWNTS